MFQILAMLEKIERKENQHRNLSSLAMSLQCIYCTRASSGKIHYKKITDLQCIYCTLNFPIYPNHNIVPQPIIQHRPIYIYIYKATLS